MGFPLATKNVAGGYFELIRKQKKNITKRIISSYLIPRCLLVVVTRQLEILVTALIHITFRISLKGGNVL